jgi:hypothetical protein
MMSASEPTATFATRLVSNRGRDEHCRAAPRMVSAYVAAVVAKLRDLAPYAAIELLVPGGSLMALLLWLYRQRKKSVVFSDSPDTLPVSGSKPLRRGRRRIHVATFLRTCSERTLLRNRNECA